MQNSYVSIDIETTGLNPKVDKITEIGAVKVIGGEVVDTFCTFVHAGKLLDEKIIKLTGITEKDLENAPAIETVMPMLQTFLEEMPILGHSIIFDYSFLKKAAVNCNLPFEKVGLDTLKIAKKYLQVLESRTLGNLCKYYGISHEAHRALGDAMATHILFQKMQREFGEEEFQFSQLLYKVKKEGPATIHQKERLYELISRHNLKVGYTVDMLTKNEASRYTDLILAKYGR